MLSSVEIFIDIESANHRAHDLIQHFADYNYDSIEFTVHVENSSLRLRLLNTKSTSIFDGSLALESYTKSIQKILQRNNLQYTIIEHLEKATFSIDSSFSPVSHDD